MATAKSTIYVKWKCSKCGTATRKPIAVKETGPRAAVEMTLGANIHAAVNDLNYQHYLRGCKCGNCGYKESWTKSKVCPISSSFAGFVMLCLLFFGGMSIMEWSFPESLIGIVMWAAIPVFIKSVGVWSSRVTDYNQRLTIKTLDLPPVLRPHVAERESDLDFKEARASVEYLRQHG